MPWHNMLAFKTSWAQRAAQQIAYSASRMAFASCRLDGWHALLPCAYLVRPAQRLQQALPLCSILHRLGAHDGVGAADGHHHVGVVDGGARSASGPEGHQFLRQSSSVKERSISLMAGDSQTGEAFLSSLLLAPSLPDSIH